MKNIEVELTFPLLNRGEVEKQLHSIAQHGKQQHQKDTYFVPVHRNFLRQHPISEWLRIRETASGASMNYKFWHNQNDDQAVSADEFESRIENPAALHEILRRLNFNAIVVVEKQRCTWMYKDTEIALDDVTGLGSFIEVEAKGNFTSIEDAKARLYEVLKEIGAKTGLQDYKGYPHLLLERRGLL